MARRHHEKLFAFGAWLVLAAGLVATGPARAAERVKLVLLGVRTGEGVTEKTAATLEELILGELSSLGKFQVIGRNDVGALAGFEKQKALLGCETDSSCMAEVAGAFGARLLASAELGKLGELSVVTLKIIDTKTATVLARSSRKVGRETELADAAEEVARDAVEKVLRDWRPDPAPPSAVVPPASPTSAARLASYGAFGLAVASGVGGWLVQRSASAIDAADRTTTTGEGRLLHTKTQADIAHADGLETASKALFGLAGAFAVAGGVAFFAFDATAGAGGEVGFAGRF